MKFWDSSALLPLLVVATATSATMAVMARDSSVLVWWATEI